MLYFMMYGQFFNPKFFLLGSSNSNHLSPHVTKRITRYPRQMTSFKSVDRCDAKQTIAVSLSMNCNFCFSTGPMICSAKLRSPFFLTALLYDSQWKCHRNQGLCHTEILLHSDLPIMLITRVAEVKVDVGVSIVVRFICYLNVFNVIQEIKQTGYWRLAVELFPSNSHFVQVEGFLSLCL